MDKLSQKPRDLNLYGEDICPNSYVFNYTLLADIRGSLSLILSLPVKSG